LPEATCREATVNVIVIKYPRIFKMYIKQTRVETKEYNSHGKISERYSLTLYDVCVISRLASILMFN